MRGNVLVDLRNVFQPALAQAAGFAYWGIGRGKLAPVNKGASKYERQDRDRPDEAVGEDVADQVA
jgi:hypothetical protein